MSKPVKSMLLKEYDRRFSDLSGALVVDIRALKAIENNKFRNTLKAKQIRVTVVKNALAANTIKDSDLKALGKVLSGPCAFVYGAESVVDVAREVVEITKKLKQIEIKGAVLDGELYEGKAGVEALSKFPTRAEAQAQVVQLLLSPARNIAGAVAGPGGAVAGCIAALIDKLEKGESVAKAG